MVKKKNLSQAFREVLKDLLAWFQFVSVPGLIIGGVALAFLARPRFTKDVDALVLIDSSQLENFLKKGKSFGFVPKKKTFQRGRADHPFSDAGGFYHHEICSTSFAGHGRY